MDFGLREVLILVGLVVIAGILFDGYRRMRKSRLGELELPEQMGGRCDDDWEFFKGELPNGGARKVAFDENGDEVDPDMAFGSALDDDFEPKFSEQEVVAERRTRRAHEEEVQETEMESPMFTGEPKDQDCDLFAEDGPMVAALERQKSERKAEPASRSAPQADKQPELDLEPSLQEVIIINIMARTGELKGTELAKVLESCGFRFGEMNIYHRYEQHTGRGSLVFSAANVVEPGIFDPAKMEHMTTPGICIFMKLPGPRRPIHGFDLLMDTSRKIANLLNADIKDEHHNIMRQQTAEHYRQRVLDFERKFLSYKASQKQV